MTTGRSSLRLDYGPALESLISATEELLARQEFRLVNGNRRWVAIKLLEGDQSLLDQLSMDSVSDRWVGELEGLRSSLPEAQRPELELADARYRFIAGLTDRVLAQPQPGSVSMSDRLDWLATHPLLGFPVFLFVMYWVFSLVVNVSAPYVDWIDQVVNGPLSAWSTWLLAMIRAPDWFTSLMVDGALAGVGGVLVFLPGLAALYFFIGLLEDSGYMARAAFVMDRLMRVLGLHGKSFVPMILGFGCAVPAIFATRTLESRRDRIITGLLVPFMSCSARLPVYVVFGMAFFGRQADAVIWALYALGILVAIVLGVVLSATILKPDHGSVFLMEIPPFRKVSLRSLWLHVAQRSRHFIRKAGTTILVASLLIWGLLNLPWGRPDLSSSWFGSVSRVAAVVFEPAGFGTWQASGSLVTGLAAKEIVVSTLNQVYVGSEPGTGTQPVSFARGGTEIVAGLGTASTEAGAAAARSLTFGLVEFGSDPAGFGASETKLSQVLGREYSPAAGFAFMVFVLLYVPCFATLAAMRAEFGTRWAAFSAVMQLAVAWAVATAAYQAGAWLGFA